MSALTKKEKQGLEDVFLSIHTKDSKYLKIKNLVNLVMTRKKNINFFKVQKQLYNS